MRGCPVLVLRRLLLALLLALVLSGPARADVCTLVAKINAYRSANSLKPLILDARLVDIAQENSQLAASLPSFHGGLRHVDSDHLVVDQQHPNSNGNAAAVAAEASSDTAPWYAKSEALIPNWTFLAENMAMGSVDENLVLDLFKKTQDYNENLLSDEAVLIGIGEYEGYWTFEFAGISDEEGIELATC
ncbi:hypothetical protein HDU83_005154 [Entophlyctis luteolus]|nr:hypothetical protein HDU82_007977 [Entophlyctis luteolus]KAJ3344484.1 hypothetical protein HDU83_005154 [Entophlyctis luteolus]KAJ3385985.1 hypothetical protein HDU84_001869 [Entophlyctis sp. JEL0112]